jgi:tellurite resistance-related uncharacterized protein
MLALPVDVKAYKRTSVFSKETVPKGLLGRHNTKENTWGLIVVESGSLTYTIYDEASTVVMLSPGQPGVIEPQVYHKVELLSDDTTFYVEFYAVEGSAVNVPKVLDGSSVHSVGNDGSLQPNAPSAGGIESANPYLISLCVLGASGVLFMVYNYYRRNK